MNRLLGRHRPHRDHIGQGLVDTQVQGSHFAHGHHQKKSTRWVWRGGHINTHHVVTQNGRHLPFGRTGLKGDGPRALTGVLHQDRCAKGVSTAGEQGGGDLLHAGVNGLDKRDVNEQVVPLLEPPTSSHIGRDCTRDEQHCKNQHHTQAMDQSNTQTVMARGNQTKRPARRYFFKCMSSVMGQ